MVHINIWFAPQSRSTALMRCLSNIPDSKVFFENFIWSYFLGDKDRLESVSLSAFLGVQYEVAQ